jgi:thiamine kinase-like enzyme
VLANVSDLDIELRRAMEAELQRLAPAVEGPWAQRFIHDDIYGPNLLFDARTDHVWLIDWGDAGFGDAALDFRAIDPEATPLVLEGYRQITTTDHGFEARVRWDQLSSTARRVREPDFRRRLEAMLAG